MLDPKSLSPVRTKIYELDALSRRWFNANGERFSGSIKVYDGLAGQSSGFDALFQTEAGKLFGERIRELVQRPAPQEAPDKTSESSCAELHKKSRRTLTLNGSTETVPVSQAASVPPFNAKLVWEAFIDAEKESVPVVEVRDEVAFDQKRGPIHIPYIGNLPIDALEDGDEIRRGDRLIGELILEKTTDELLAIKLRSKTRRVDPGDLISIESRQARASFDRRSSAVKRAILNETTIPELPGFFSPNSKSISRGARRIMTSEDAKVYGLNPAQSEALQTLWNTGPVSFLQGPPGTGKTTFIAAYVHFALTQSNAKKVLIASQSHEAVDGAAEKIVAKMREERRPLDILRVASNLERVAESLRFAHAGLMQEKMRNRHDAERSERLAESARSLGLDVELARSMVRLHDGAYRTAHSIDTMRRARNSGEAGPYIEGQIRRLTRALTHQTAELDFDVEPLLNLDEGVFDLARVVAAQGRMQIMEQNGETNRRSVDKLSSLIDLADEWRDALGDRRRTLEEFYVANRTLVCGTCVGLGHQKLGLASQTFDLAIVDEAARATSGELLVAIQSARKVLLVGDQKQLLPLHDRKILASVSAKTQVAEHLLAASDFERGFGSPYGKVAGRSLNEQYRMAPKIGTLVSRIFYPNVGLKTGRGPVPAVYQNLPAPFDDECAWIKVEDGAGEARRGHSFVNHAEAEAIARALESLSRETDFLTAVLPTLAAEQALVGVICMYAPQKEVIANRLATAAIAIELRDRIKVGTVDSYQGKENPIVLLSLVRNNSARNVGFVAQENRANVALSRAMERLVIFGSASTFRNNGSPWAEVLAEIEKAGRVRDVSDFGRMQETVK